MQNNARHFLSKLPLMTIISKNAPNFFLSFSFLLFFFLVGGGGGGGIVIALAKICFFHIVISHAKIPDNFALA